MLPSIIVFLTWCFPYDVPTDKNATGYVQPLPRLKTPAECKSLPHEEYEYYIEQLGKERNYTALEELCRADLGYAITIYVQILDDKKAIHFCKKYPIGSCQWENAFWGLASHRKDPVIDYVKATCRTNNPWVRASCYSLCLKAGWGDLIESAKRDINDKTPMTDAIGHTLGDRARLYMKLLPEVQKHISSKR